MAATIIFNNGAELAAFLKDSNGPATLEAITEPKLLKKSRTSQVLATDIYPYGVRRVRQEYAWVGASYESLVNRQQSREGGPSDFKSAPLPWGQFVAGSRVVIEHKGKYYMRYYRKVSANFRLTRTQWVDSGLKPLPEKKRECLPEFLPARNEERIRERQGVDDIVEPRTISLDNITRLVADGRVYVKHGYLAVEEYHGIADLHRQFEGALNG